METISTEASSVKNRKAAEAFILRILTRILPKGKSVQIYKEKFKNMSDKEFDKYMQDLRDEKTAIVLIVPNFTGKHISLDNNLNIAKEEFNYDFFQRLYIGKQGNNPGYMTPIKYLVVDLPIRRQSQSLIKKISVSDTNRKVDKLTGQLSSTPETKSSRITYPETQLLVALGLDASLVELLKYRGGDIRGFTAMNGMISKYGHANLATLKPYASGVESTNTLSSYLKAMHLKNNLSKK